MAEETAPPDREITRGEVAEYLHDLVGQLAEMATRAGLRESSEALTKAQRAIEGEF